MLLIEMYPAVAVGAPELYSEIPTVNQPEEVGIALGCDSDGTTYHEVIAIARVIAKLRQHVSPADSVIHNAVVAAVA